MPRTLLIISDKVLFVKCNFKIKIDTEQIVCYDKKKAMMRKSRLSLQSTESARSVEGRGSRKLNTPLSCALNEAVGVAGNAR